MTTQQRVIKCKFCDWRTNLWGRKSNPGKAFRRLQIHIFEDHFDAPEVLLESIEVSLTEDWTNET